MAERKSNPYQARQIGPEAMKAFAHPLRMAIYDLLSQQGSATATTLAHELKESTGQTSYHLRQLERHGFVVEDEGKGTGRERWWRPVGFSVEGVELAKNPATAAQVELMLRTQIEEQVRDKTRWLRSALDEPAEWVAASLNDRATTSMTAGEVIAMQHEVQEVLHKHYSASKERGPLPDERRVRIYLDVIPLPHQGEGNETAT